MVPRQQFQVKQAPFIGRILSCSPRSAEARVPLPSSPYALPCYVTAQRKNESWLVR